MILFGLFQSRSARNNPVMGITPEQFKKMQQRLGATRRGPAPVFEHSSSPSFKPHTIILGLDPSLRGTGYGVIQLAKPSPRTLAHGTISCPAGWEHSRCLVKIVRTLREVLKMYQPTVCIIEGLFYSQNFQTA